MKQETELKFNLFLRLRPRIPIEQNYSQEETINIIKIDSNKAINLENKQIFYFDKIFNPETEENEICTNTTSKVINNALNGITSSIICYGGNCTGKTYTMEKIIPNAMKEIFISDLSKYNLRISFMEYYLNEWTDLLNKKTNLVINNGEFKDLTLLKINNFDEFNQLYNKGKRNRLDLHKENNNRMMNINVYYSHSILTLNIFKDNNTLFSKIFFIDLGSRTKGNMSFTQNRKDFKEVTSMNNSLSNFEDTIKALAKKQVCTFRQDKFLQIFKQCFDNKCYLSFIMHCADLKKYKADTMITLDLAKSIKRL